MGLSEYIFMRNHYGRLTDFFDIKCRNLPRNHRHQQLRLFIWMPCQIHQPTYSLDHLYLLQNAYHLRYNHCCNHQLLFLSFACSFDCFCPDSVYVAHHPVSSFTIYLTLGSRVSQCQSTRHLLLNLKLSATFAFAIRPR